MERLYCWGNKTTLLWLSVLESGQGEISTKLFPSAEGRGYSKSPHTQDKTLPI